MTDGGKPIYSRYGDEVENCMLFGTFSAIITKYTVFLSNKIIKQKLHYISNENSIMIFYYKNALVFIAYSNKNDSVSLLTSQLEYLYKQLLSILSEPYVLAFENHSSKCLQVMAGTEVFFEQMIEMTSHTLISVLKSYPVAHIKFRNKIQKICKDNKGEALMCIIMTPYEIIDICYSSVIRKTEELATDIILILNLMLVNPSLRQTESWIPICLPGISTKGYLQLYCQFTKNQIGVCFITNTQDPTVFMHFSRQFTSIK